MPNFNPLDDMNKEQAPVDKTISDMDRIVLQNLFDTQPKRRESYLKKLGFEMNQKDENEYRPIGSTGGYSEIDPGFEAYFKKGGLKEFRQDVTDIGFDTLATDASVAGAVVGGAAGAPGGPLAIPAAILGGAFGNAVAEGVKKFSGDLLLDENVPVDKSGLILQSLFAGMAGPLLKGAGKLGKEGIGLYLDVRKQAIINAAKQSGGGLTEEILNKAIKRPEMFTKEAVAGANGKLKETYRGIFGIEDPLRLDAPERISGGAFGSKMSTLNEEYANELGKLAVDKNANFTSDEITSPMKKIANDLNKKFSKTSDEEAAYSYIKGKIAEIEKKRGGKSSSINPEILNAQGESIAELSTKAAKDLSFKDAREFLTSIQSEMSAKDSAGDFINPAGRVLSPAVNGQTGVLSIINKKASSVGSNLPEINAQRSRVLQAYNTAVETLTPANITNAFIGGDTIKKSMIRDAASEIDGVLGSNFSKTIEDGSMQRVVENMYSNPKAFGGGRVNAQMVVEAARQGLVGAAVGGGAGASTGMAIPGAIIGGVGGAIKGAKDAAFMAAPERALGELRKISNQIDNLPNLSMPEFAKKPIQVAGQELGISAGELLAPEQQAPEQSAGQFDPLSDFDPLKDMKK